MTHVDPTDPDSDLPPPRGRPRIDRTWLGILPSLWSISFYCLARTWELLRGIAFLRSASDRLLDFIRACVLGLTPTSALEMRAEVNRKKYIVVAASAFIATFIFSLVLNALFSILSKTAWGSQANRVYFIEDLPNLMIYAIIAPTYIMFSILLIYAVSRSVTLFPRILEGPSSTREQIKESAKTTAAISFAIILSSVLQINYYRDSVLYQGADFPCKSVCVKYFYWFVDPVGDATRVLNAAGIYYFLSQFLRLFIVVMAGFAFVIAASSMLRANFRINASTVKTPEDAGKLQLDLTHFSIVEMWAKGLVATLHVHFNVWKSSCLSGGENIKIAAIALAVFCFTVLALPRAIAEYRLFRLLSAIRASDANSAEWVHLTDIRDGRIRVLITIAFWTVITISLFLWYRKQPPVCNPHWLRP